MEKDLKFGTFSEVDDHAEHVAEIQNRIILKIFNAIEEGITNGDDVVNITEMVEADKVIITKEALLEAKGVYLGLGLPVTLDYLSVQSEDGTIKQGFRIEVDLQPDTTESSEI